MDVRRGGVVIVDRYVPDMMIHEKREYVEKTIRAKEK